MFHYCQQASFFNNLANKYIIESVILFFSVYRNTSTIILQDSDSDLPHRELKWGILVERRDEMALALEGIKVIDVSQVMAAPIAARHLADFGAEVIHVENPVTGDAWRTYQAGQGGAVGVPSDINYNWESLNRNKRGLALDLSQERSREIVYKLVEKADIFVTNLRFWEKEKFGLEYDTLHRLNPRLIYGSLTGYGKKGPDRNAPAYDSTAAWSRGGIHHMLSFQGVPNVGFRPGFVDTSAALALFAGVMMALYVREQTGVGQEVELSLFNMGIYHLTFDISGALVTGRDIKDEPPIQQIPQDEETVKRRKQAIAEAQAAFARLSDLNRQASPNPLALSYTTKDDREVLLGGLRSDRYWSRMCQALGRPDLEHDPRFASHELRTENRLALYEIVKDIFLSRTLEEWKQRLSEAGIPYGPRQKLSEVINDPQARANDYFIPFDHPTYGPIEVITNPIHLSETPASIRMPAPEFSQHTEEILLELGYTWEDIAQFKEARMIA